MGRCRIIFRLVSSIPYRQPVGIVTMRCAFSNSIIRSNQKRQGTGPLYNLADNPSVLSVSISVHPWLKISSFGFASNFVIRISHFFPISVHPWFFAHLTHLTYLPRRFPPLSAFHQQRILHLPTVNA